MTITPVVIAFFVYGLGSQRMSAPSESPSKSARLQIQGMHCAACVSRVEKALRSVPGVEHASVNLPLERAQVSFSEESPAGLEACITAVNQLGYSAKLADSADRQQQSHFQRTELRSQWNRLLLAVPCTVIVIVIHMGHLHFPGDMLIVAVLSGVVLFGSGYQIVERGVTGLFRLGPDMDTLVSLGGIAAWVISLVGWLFPGIWEQPPIFFEAAATVICFVLIGRYLETRARRETVSATDALLELQPREASVWRNGEESRVSVAELNSGDVVRIRPGERIPVDGIIQEGRVSVDQAMVTGESMPVSKSEGDEILAGTMNIAGGMLAKVTRVGEATFLQQIAGHVRDAQGTKAPIARLADRIAGILVPIVLLLSLLTLAGWLYFGPSGEGLRLGILAGVTVLVISCPCALGLATPTAVATAMGRAAQLGLLIRDGETLERLSAVDTVVFDKTGTLTQANFTVSQIERLPAVSEDQLLQFTAAIEERSEHPLGLAIVNHVKLLKESSKSRLAPQTAGLVSLGMYGDAVEETETPLPQVKNFVNHPGLGASGDVDGHSVVAGNVRFLKDQGIDFEPLNGFIEKSGGQGGTCVVVAIDGIAAGAFSLVDTLRQDARETIESLRKMGLSVHLLTGDRVESAGAVAEKLEIQSVHAQVLPDEKAAVVKELQRDGHVVAMVGDGVNDAPVLAAADIGMAMGTGTDVAQAAAPVIVASNELTTVADGLALAVQTMRIIRQNLALAFVYNLIGIPLAAGALYPVTGWLLPPMFAAAAMSLSSVSVVFNSLRLRSFPSLHASVKTS